MFHNVGSKIKIIAEIFCFIGIVCSIILALNSFLTIEEVDEDLQNLYIIKGILFLFLGPLGSWISSLFIYGFGSLISDTQENNFYFTEIVFLLKDIRKASLDTHQKTHLTTTSSSVNDISKTTLDEHETPIICWNCGTKNLPSRNTCWNCDREI